MALAALAFAAGTAAAQSLPRAKGGLQDRKTRPFQLGVTLMPHDMSVEGLAALFAFVNSHADLIAIKFDEGVPWQEALDRRGYSEAVENGLKEKVPKVEQKKVFIATTPLNGDKTGPAGYRAAEPGDPRAAKWSGRELDDPNLIRAYAFWCRDLIARYRPDAFAYAIEANAPARNPQAWKKFLVLAKEVYTTLKKENPNLPLFVTLSVETANEAEQLTIQRKAIREVLAWSDYVAVSTIPYVTEHNPAKIRKDHFSSIAALGAGKPFAITETAFLAEDLSVPGFERIGKAAWQQEYLRFALEEAARLNAKLVVWMLPRDYDELWKKVAGAGEGADFYRLFKDTGLLDGEGNPRKAFETWEQWRKLPIK
jgi:hypothetical protein